MILDRYTTITIGTGNNALVISPTSENDVGIASGSLMLDQKIVDGDLEFGRLMSSEFSAQLFNTNQDFQGEQITADVTEDNVTTRIFTGVIESSKQDWSNTYRDIIAYDWIYYHREDNIASWWNSFWVSTRTQATVKQIRDSLLTYMGFSALSDTYINDNQVIKNEFQQFTNIKFETIFKMLCEIQLTIPHIKGDGSFELITFGTTATDISGMYEGSNSEWEDFTTQQITGIGIYDTSSNMVQLVGTNTNVLNIAGNLFLLNMSASQLTTIGNNMLTALADFTFVPASVKMILSDFSLSLGKKVSTDVGNTYVMQNTYSGSLLVEQTIKGVAYSDVLNGNVPSINDDLITANKIAVVQHDIDGLSTEFGRLENNLENNYSTTTEMNSAIEQSAEGIRTEVSQTYVNQTTYNAEVQRLQDEIDGAIESYTGSAVPTLNNYPANEWTTTTERDKHLGDLYLVNASGGSYAGFYYRFDKSGSTYSWVHIPDNEVQKALADAAEANQKAEAAQATADGIADDLSDNYSTTQQMNSAINQKANEITQTVSTTYETKSDATSKLNTANTNAQGYATQAKNEANASTDSKLTNYYTKTQTDSAITQKANEITLNVSQTYATQSTVTNVKNSTIKSDTLHYLATSASSGVTISTAGWTTTVQSVTATNKYLWTYHTYTYGDDHTSNTTPVITGVYGDKGETGTSVNVDSISYKYAVSDNTETLKGEIVSFTNGSDAPLKECKVDIEATQDLHGYSKPWAGGAGKNKYIGSPSFDNYVSMETYQIDSETYNGHEVIYKSTAWSGAYASNIDLEAGVTYTFSAMVKMSTTSSIRVFMGNDTTLLNTNVGTDWERVTVQISPTTNITNARIRIESVTNGVTIYLSEFQLEINSQATTYEPYSNICPISGHSSITVTVASTSGGSGDDTTVSLGRTVYGGTLDVTTGVLTVTKAYKNLTTARNISGTYQGSIIYNVGSPETSDADFSKPFICNSLEYVGNNPYSADWKYGTCINAGGTSFNLWIKDGAFVDVADATTYLGTHPTEICYYLATPQTFNLTPTQVKTLLGYNNISADSGEIEVTYYANDMIVPESGWQDDIPDVPQGQYLWTNTITTYTDGTSSNTYTFSRQGEQGETGVGISEVIPLRYASNSTTAPATPTSNVTNTDTAVGKWTRGIPALTSTYKYMWTCDQVKYDDDTYVWTTVVRDNALTDLTQRMSNVELKITPEAIVGTVEESGEFASKSEVQQLANMVAVKVNSSGRLVTAALGVDPDTSTSYFKVKADDIDIISNGNIQLTGKSIGITSTNFSVTSAGAITSTAGTIAGWSIDSEKLYKSGTVSGITYASYLKANELKISSGLSTLTEFGQTIIRSGSMQLIGQSGNPMKNIIIDGDGEESPGTGIGYIRTPRLVTSLIEPQVDNEVTIASKIKCNTNGNLTATTIYANSEFVCGSGIELGALTKESLSFIDFHWNTVMLGNDFTARICQRAESTVDLLGKNSSTWGIWRAASFNSQSSKYVKKNIKDVTEKEARNILKLRPVKFDYKNSDITNQRGLIAEEVLEVMPEMVSVPKDYTGFNKDEPWNTPSIDYSKFVPYLIKMIQIQQKDIDALKNK